MFWWNSQVTQSARLAAVCNHGQTAAARRAATLGHLPPAFTHMPPLFTADKGRDVLGTLPAQRKQWVQIIQVHWYSDQIQVEPRIEAGMEPALREGQFWN